MSTTGSRSPSPSPAANADDAGSTHSVDGKQPASSSRSPSPHPKLDAESPSTPANPAPSDPAAATDSAGASQNATSISTGSGVSESLSPPPVAGVTAANGDWQAIWSPAHNAYYFYNAKTQETTWANPLQPAASASASPSPSAGSPGPSASTSSMYDLQAAAAAQGIDPALAFLDPSLAAGPSNPAAFTYSAKFNARTGAFTRPDGRDPSHLSEYERAKRMSEFYFDVNAWEHEVEARKLEEAHEEETRKRKRPTKKDLERFKEQKRAKKIAKTAWLRT